MIPWKGTLPLLLKSLSNFKADQPKIFKPKKVVLLSYINQSDPGLSLTTNLVGSQAI